jgi:hypothetical protein
MTAMYGPKFTSFYGESADDTWVTVLVGVTALQMAGGLNACLERYPEWPPGAAQFRALCLGLDPRNVDSKGNDAAWQHARIESANRENEASRQTDRLRLTGEGYVSRRKKAGRKSIAEMKGMFT